MAALIPFEQDARRAENMTGIVKRGGQTRSDFDRRLVLGSTAKLAQSVGGVDEREQRRLRRTIRQISGLALFLVVQMRGVEDHQPSEIECGRRGDDFAAESPLGQKRQAAAMIEMCMGEKNEIDRSGIEAERPGVFVAQLAAALQQAAIDQYAFAGAFNEMAGTGYAAISAVKGKLHEWVSLPIRGWTPALLPT